MNQPNLAIFDMDGLIFDTERQFSCVLANEMKKKGYIYTEENYHQTLGLARDGARKVMKSLYGDDYPFDEISTLARQALNQIADEGGLRIKKGIPALLDFFTGNKTPCVVASSSPKNAVEKYISSAGLSKYFKECFGGDSIKNPKPAPDIFLNILNMYNIPSNYAVVFEDSENGAIAAINADIPVIIIPDMKSPKKEVLDKSLFVAEDALGALKFLESHALFI